MNVKTFQARTLPDALHMIRHELGPDAQVLSTEKKATSFWGRLTGQHLVEVTALSSHPPSVAPAPSNVPHQPNQVTAGPTIPGEPIIGEDYRSRFKQFAAEEQGGSLLEAMLERTQPDSSRLPSTLFRLFTDLIDADVDDGFARGVVEDLQRHSTPAELANFDIVREKVTSMLTRRIACAPEIGAYGSERRVVALIGPTGVGKTTTVAKLAANLRLRDKRRVGMITVDTYRIAAVDQLRAYADIIDLPMEVVTTPREMRDAVTTLADLDILLIDTAGRSPHDDIQIQELKAMLTEARADEVQLVLSSVANARHLTRLVEHFRTVGPTSLLVTKLDEAMSIGHLLPLFCDGLPVSYTTHGQNVPDDILPANPTRLVESILAN